MSRGISGAGSTYLANGRPEEAEAAYREVIEVNPVPRKRMWLGEFYFCQEHTSAGGACDQNGKSSETRTP